MVKFEGTQKPGTTMLRVYFNRDVLESVYSIKSNNRFHQNIFLIPKACFLLRKKEGYIFLVCMNVYVRMKCMYYVCMKILGTFYSLNGFIDFHV